MPSPFPGMDPYLEAPHQWQDLHNDLTVSIREEIQPALVPRYFAKVTYRAVTDRLGPEEVAVVIPDVAVAKRRRAPRQRPGGGRAATATLDAPVEVDIEVPVPARQYGIRIVRVPEGRLVTAIEIVSPANKRPDSRDRRNYLRKRDRFFESSVHFLEIDLLRGGERWSAAREPKADYRVFLSRAGRRPRAEVWPVGLRDRLPRMPVPLAGDDPDVPLDLQAAFDRAYDRAGYAHFVPYGGPVPSPDLSAADAAWAKARLRAAARP